MSKFNKTNTIMTENRSGHAAYRMADKEQLVTAVLTSMFGEPKFYGSTDNDIVRLAVKCAKEDPEFLAKLACYARREGNLRSVSHVLTAVIAREAHEFTRPVIRQVVVRPDDITEILTCYQAMYGRPFPNAMKREIAAAMLRFNEYQIAKYNGGNKAMKFRDVLRITHPSPATKEQAEMFGRILTDTLETPYTWETELSARGNTKEVWEELIASGKVGYMALLRNLANIARSGADIKPVLKTLADPEQVKKSRQLPFRFYSAYRTLAMKGLLTREIEQALEAAVSRSVNNMEQLKGRTLIAVDVSGSMGLPVSGMSGVDCQDIATLMAAMASRICEEAVVCYFSCGTDYYMRNGKRVERPGYKTESYGKDEHILEICRRNHSVGAGGTDLYLPMMFALEEDKSEQPFDRVIYFSDNECNRPGQGLYKAVQGMVDTYRRERNENFWVHGVDLAGYGTQQFCGDRFNLIAGWNDTVLSFIQLAEAGVSTLVDTIGEYQIAA